MSDNEWQRVVQRMTSSGTTSGIEWYNKWQRMIQRVTTSGIASDNEWQRVRKNDNGWQRMTASHKTNEYEWE